MAKSILILFIFAAVTILLQVNALESAQDCKSCCELPKDFANGKLRTIKRETRGLQIVPTGSVLQFKCDNEYVLTGAKHVICGQGVWFPSLPVCIAKTAISKNKTKCDACCEIPKNFTNGKLRIVDTKTRGLSIVPEYSRLQFNCNDEYILNGTDVSQCIQGTWLPEIPSCTPTIKCKDPGEDSNGEREGPCCKVGDVISYSCIEGYEIIGPSAITCTEVGTWSNTRPTCQPKMFCAVPDSIINGKIEGKRRGDFYLPDDEIMIICDEGYTVGNKSDYLFCEMDGQWDYDIPECTSIINCNIPESPENGYIFELISGKNRIDFPYKFEINFICNPGYRLIGDSWRSCGAYGWSNRNPTCEEIQCPDPGTPENGWIQGVDYQIGNVTLFGCYSGYNLLGSARRVCMENGQWSGELTRCDTGKNHCPNPGSPIGGTKLGNRYNLHSVVTFHSNPGRMLIGSANRTCQKNGKWSGEEAKCFSEYDFDNKRSVGFKIKSLLKNETTLQEVKVSNYMSNLESNDSESPNGRGISLVFPGNLIIAFIFDVSGSVGFHNFKKCIDFAKAMVKVIKVTDDGARVGAITFSSKANAEFNPLEYNTTEDVIEALDKINYTTGGTATSSALGLFKDEMIPLVLEVLGRRSRIIAFLMTDGKVNMAGNPKRDADALKEDGVEIYCIGITGNRNMKTLYDIATATPEQAHVFILDGYESMNWLVQEIVNDTIDYSRCGVRQSIIVEVKEEEKRGRIVGGKRVVKAWPWMAIIFFVDPFNTDTSRSSGICGASIIDRKWIMTAAHCMHDEDKNNNFFWRKENEMIINFGLVDMRNKTNIQQRAVLRYITHPSYEIKTFDYDIALIELSKPIEYNELVRPVCLPPPENDLHKEPTFYQAGQKAAVVGWGHDSALKKTEIKKARPVNVLNEIMVSIQKRSTCRDSLKKHPENNVFTDRMMCAGGNRKDACPGDSGGPLMQKLTDDIGEEYWTAVGIVSWGIGCGLPNTYGYYTKVSMAIDWIKDTIKNE